MERVLIYGLAMCGIAAGLWLFYRKPWPFPARTFDRKKQKRCFR